MTPEGRVKDALKKYLKEIGAWQFWPVSGGMGKHGIPDCIVCYKGFFIGIECKAPGRREEENRGCSALQVREGKAIDAAHGIWLVFDGEDDDWKRLKDFIYEINIIQERMWE